MKSQKQQLHVGNSEDHSMRCGGESEASHVRNRAATFACGMIVSVVAVLGGGCASTQCAFTRTSPSADLSGYTTCYVADATTDDSTVVPQEVLRLTADRIASELRGRRTFTTVLREEPSDEKGALHVRSTYTSYRPGSRMARAMLIGVGTADLKLLIQLYDGETGQELAAGDVHEFWGFGGLMGMSRGIEDMQTTAFKHAGAGIDKACRKTGGKR